MCKNVFRYEGWRKATFKKDHMMWIVSLNFFSLRYSWQAFISFKCATWQGDINSPSSECL